jgi:hypothetical protein
LLAGLPVALSRALHRRVANSTAFLYKSVRLRCNRATVGYLATTGNPTGGGVYAKWLLARVDAVTWAAVDGLNGGEVSYKTN